MTAFGWSNMFDVAKPTQFSKVFFYRTWRNIQL